MNYVQFNPKEGFWNDDLGWSFSDDEATTVPFESSLSTVSDEGQYAIVSELLGAKAPELPKDDHLLGLVVC